MIKTWTPKTIPNINYKPFIKQYKALQALLDDSVDEVLYGGAGGGGKSYLGCMWLIIMCLKYPKSRWLMGRSKLKSLKETTLMTFFKVCSDQQLRGDGNHNLYNQGTNTITFYNGSEILLKDLFYYPSDPDFDSLGSLEIAGAFVDEVAQVTKRAIEVVKSRMGWKYEDGSEIKTKLFMSCNPTKEFVYEAFYKPSKEGKLPSNKRFIPALPTDNPHLSQGRRDALDALTGIDRKRLRLGLWEYDDDPNALVHYDSILSLQYNEHVILKDAQGHIIGTKLADNIEDKTKFITCDPARLGNDSTVIWVWTGLCAHKLYKIEKQDTKQVSDKIKELCKQFNIPHSNVIIDSDGVGGGVADQVPGSIQFHNAAKVFNNEAYENLKTQCYYKLASLINDKSIYISTELSDMDEQRLKEELEQIKAKNIDKDIRKQLVGKEEIKRILGRSPDMSDALMLRMYPIVKRSNKTLSQMYGFGI